MPIVIVSGSKVIFFYLSENWCWFFLWFWYWTNKNAIFGLIKAKEKQSRIRNFSPTSVGLINLKQKFSGISSKNVLNLVHYPILLPPEGLFWGIFCCCWKRFFKVNFGNQLSASQLRCQSLRDFKNIVSSLRLSVIRSSSSFKKRKLMLTEYMPWVKIANPFSSS